MALLLVSIFSFIVIFGLSIFAAVKKDEPGFLFIGIFGSLVMVFVVLLVDTQVERACINSKKELVETFNMVPISETVSYQINENEFIFNVGGENGIKTLPMGRTTVTNGSSEQRVEKWLFTTYWTPSPWTFGTKEDMVHTSYKVFVE